MSLYLLQDPKDPTFFYARDPDDIVETLRYYHKREPWMASDPNVMEVFRSIPDPAKIPQVEKGVLTFRAGMMVLSDKVKDKNIFEELQVLPDFVVRANLEAGPYLMMLKSSFPNLKRGNLYKVQTSGLFATQTFLPQDVVDAIIAYDLTDFLRAGDDLTDEVLATTSSHPNLAPSPVLVNYKSRN